MKIKALLSEGKKTIDRELNGYLTKKGKLAKAMRYSVFAGGKRFRPILCLATAEALGKKAEKVLPFACAVELVHTFTLIHDDLPAMDNSDFRRGKPTCHKVYGEAMAILAGDALNTLAFKIISAYPEAARELSVALLEVVEGQAADLEATGKRLSLKQLKHIHLWKTAALLKACVKGVAFICEASTAKVKALSTYAEHLGLAFQITDDILDATSTQKKMGKPVKADVGKGFPHFIGLEKSSQLAEQEKERAMAALHGFDNKADGLRRIAEYVVARNF